jgi:hypothetical protein
MSGKNQTIDWSRFVDNRSAIDLLKNSIGKSIEYNYYNSRTTFKVLALSPSIPLSTAMAAALPGGSIVTTAGGEVSKYIIKGRIIDENSPHSWIPDPCAWSKGDGQAVMDLIMAHTTYLVYGDPRASMRVPVKPGDIFLAEMTPDNNSYDLQYGRFLEVINRTGADKPYNSSQKSCNKSLKSRFPVFPEFGEGLGIGPKGATYNGMMGIIPIQNGKLPPGIMGKANTDWSTGGSFLIDLIPSVDALAKAYFEWTGTTPGGGTNKKLQLNGTYRTYANAIKICGGINAKGKCNNGLSSLPGNSRHGWGCAFDWQLTIGWGDKSIAARRKQFKCPEWKWMWLNSHLHTATDGVTWSNPAWARPKVGEGSAYGGDPTTKVGADPYGDFPGYVGKGSKLEAWHWEPSNFNSLITGIGK